MTVLLVLLTFTVFLVVDHFKRPRRVKLPYRTEAQARGTMYTTLGFEMLGQLAQDGGEPFEAEQLPLKFE